MSRIGKRNLMIAVAVAAIVAGVIVAVAGSGGGHAHARSARAGRAAAAARAGGRTTVEAAAGYLGLTKTQLRKQLRSGRTLAQIAAAHNRSSTGLLEALLSARAARLNAEVSAKRLSPAAEQKALARLRRRLTAQLERTPGYSDLPVAAHYLGVSTAELRADLHAGRSLAQIAAATPGKSAAGLIDARVASREATLQAALAAGRISRAAERELAAGLRQRITSEVERKPTLK
jgi:hypothetical protein